MKKLLIFCLALGFVFAISGPVAFGDGPEYEVTEIENLAYGPYLPGNQLDLYLPDVPGDAELPLIIWHSGSAWFSNAARTALVPSLSPRSSRPGATPWRPSASAPA